MEEILKEIVEALRESNKLTCEILRLWNLSEDRNRTRMAYDYTHHMTSAFILLDKLRKEYNDTLKDLVKNQDDTDLRIAAEYLRMELLEISEEVFPNRRITLRIPEVLEVINDFNRKKEEEGDKK